MQPATVLPNGGYLYTSQVPVAFQRTYVYTPSPTRIPVTLSSPPVGMLHHVPSPTYRLAGSPFIVSTGAPLVSQGSWSAGSTGTASGRESLGSSNQDFGFDEGDFSESDTASWEQRSNCETPDFPTPTDSYRDVVQRSARPMISKSVHFQIDDFEPKNAVADHDTNIHEDSVAELSLHPKELVDDFAELQLEAEAVRNVRLQFAAIDDDFVEPVLPSLTGSSSDNANRHGPYPTQRSVAVNGTEECRPLNVNIFHPSENVPYHLPLPVPSEAVKHSKLFVPNRQKCKLGAIGDVIPAECVVGNSHSSEEPSVIPSGLMLGAIGSPPERSAKSNYFPTRYQQMIRAREVAKPLTFNTAGSSANSSFSDNGAWQDNTRNEICHSKSINSSSTMGSRFLPLFQT